MASNRTWFLQLNLDEMNALTSSLWTDADRAAALQGLSLGCNAGSCPRDVPEPFRMAWEIGLGWRVKAEGFRASRVMGGKASATVRKAQMGTAQPSRTSARSQFEHSSSEHMFGGCLNPEHMLGGCSDGVQAVLELNQKPETRKMGDPDPTKRAPDQESKTMVREVPSPAATPENSDDDIPLPVEGLTLAIDRDGPLPGWIKVPTLHPLVRPE